MFYSRIDIRNLNTFHSVKSLTQKGYNNLPILKVSNDVSHQEHKQKLFQISNAVRLVTKSSKFNRVGLTNYKFKYPAELLSLRKLAPIECFHALM